MIFFYCDFQDNESASATEVMYSLLCQMLSHLHDDGAGTRAESLIDDLLKEGADDIRTDMQRLPLLVARATEVFLRPPLIIIDALDQCKDVENLLDAFIDWNMRGTMRLIVTSRPLQVIKERLLDVTRISVISWDKFEEGVSVDIPPFIESKLGICDWFGALDADLKEWVKSIMAKKAEGM